MSSKTACEAEGECMEDPECPDFMHCIQVKLDEERNRNE